MPTPRKNESQSDFVSRCIPIVIDEGTAEDNKQAAAICYSMWREKKEQESAMSLWETVKGFFREKPAEEVEEDGRKEIAHPFTVWKDKETGQYRWLAVYSNKWRDEDNPPEILASAAHKEFEEAVDKGDWPYPEAWLWHVPGTRFGVADFVTYDDNGFALVSGTVDKGKEDVAEELAKDEDLATSHGMPIKEIERDEEDSTIITRYRSVEISPLPREAAANKHTGFEFINQEVKMAVPEYKRAWMEEHLGADGLKELDGFLADKAKELDEMNIQSKDATEDVEDVQEAAQETVEEEGDEEEVAEPKEAEAPAEEDAPAYVTADEVAEAVGAYLKPIMDELSALRQTAEEQAKSIKELKQGSEEKAAEIIANTPAASLSDRIGSVIGSSETFVDGRTSLAKSGPKETEDEKDKPTLVPLLNDFMNQAWGQREQ